MNNDKAKAWNDGYSKGRNCGGSKAIPANPFAGTEASDAFFEGYSLGMKDYLNCSKTGSSLSNPYSTFQEKYLPGRF